MIMLTSIVKIEESFYYQCAYKIQCFRENVNELSVLKDKLQGFIYN